jgi:biopolymer transport protein ExbD
MPVHVPGPRLMHGVKLNFVQKKVSGHGGRGVNAELSLVSMIDFLVVTVVFLLMTFSASGEITIAKGVQLPYAQNAEDMLDAPIVAVSGSNIMVDGVLVGNTRTVEENKQIRRIEELFNSLKGKRDTFKQAQPNKEFPGVVVLEIDQDVQAVVVKSVFQTAAFAGYPRVSFMVNKSAQSH